MSDYEAHVSEVLKQVPDADPQKVAEAFSRYEKDFLIPLKGLPAPWLVMPPPASDSGSSAATGAPGVPQGRSARALQVYGFEICAPSLHGEVSDTLLPFQATRPPHRLDRPSSKDDCPECAPHRTILRSVWGAVSLCQSMACPGTREWGRLLPAAAASRGLPGARW